VETVSEPPGPAEPIEKARAPLIPDPFSAAADPHHSATEPRREVL